MRIATQRSLNPTLTATVDLVAKAVGGKRENSTKRTALKNPTKFGYDKDAALQALGAATTALANAGYALERMDVPRQTVTFRNGSDRFSVYAGSFCGMQVIVTQVEA